MTILAWHWCRDFGGEALRRDLVIITPGETEHHDGPLVLCESGLHASTSLLDAMVYAPGGILRRVECDGEVVERKRGDKLVCSMRRELWRVPWSVVGPVVVRWAAWCGRRTIRRATVSTSYMAFLAVASCGAAREAARHAASDAGYASDMFAIRDASDAANSACNAYPDNGLRAAEKATLERVLVRLIKHAARQAGIEVGA